jgi:hypothetical protein
LTVAADTEADQAALSEALKQLGRAELAVELHAEVKAILAAMQTAGASGANPAVAAGRGLDGLVAKLEAEAAATLAMVRLVAAETEAKRAGGSIGRA